MKVGDLGEFVEQTYREDFENGRLKAGYEAALFCLKNGVPFPTWLIPLAEEALKRDFLTSEGGGKGRAKGRYRLAERRKGTATNDGTLGERRRQGEQRERL